MNFPSISMEEYLDGSNQNKEQKDCDTNPLSSSVLRGIEEAADY